MSLAAIVWLQLILSTDILKAINMSVKPCDDFYEFACGNYPNQVTLPDEEPSMNYIAEANKKLRRQMKFSQFSVMFQAPSTLTDTKTYKMVKQYYRACMNVGALEKLGLQPLKDMLAKYGGWPMVIGESWNGKSYEWLETAARIYRDYGISRILRFIVKDDPRNSSNRILGVDQPVLGLGKRDYYINENYSDNLDAYRTYIYATAIQLGAEEYRAMEETDAIIEFETNLAKITVREEKRRNMTELYNPMTVEEMKQHFHKVTFERWFLSMSQNGWKLDDDQVVDVAGAPYLKLLPDVLAQTDVRTLANYQLLAPVLSMIPYLAPSLRGNYKQYRKVLYGLKKFLPRWEECVVTTMEALDWPVSSMYVREYFKANAKEETAPFELSMTYAAVVDGFGLAALEASTTLGLCLSIFIPLNVEAIVHHLMQAMKQTLKEASWMDEETKLRGQEKLEKVAKKIAYPDYIFNQSRILQDFNGVEIDETLYFDSALSISKSSFNERRRLLREFHNRSDWSKGPAVVNAFYSAAQNSITFPAGILQNPFFIHNAPRYVNYGRIGMVIGHEITHGYDDRGRQFDGQGNLHLWWTHETLSRYQNGTRCFVDQYSRIKDEATGLYLNGELEVGENIADNGGLKLAYKAYRTWEAEQTFTEPSLPDLPDYTPDQMFFIAFAQVWCDVIRPAFRARMIVTDHHAPKNYRVNVPLQNFPAFAEAFQCSTGSRMNPKDRCVVW